MGRANIGLILNKAQIQKVVYAPSTISSPTAKLTMCKTPKIIAKPIPANPYTVPSSTPLTNASKKMEMGRHLREAGKAALQLQIQVDILFQ